MEKATLFGIYDEQGLEVGSIICVFPDERLMMFTWSAWDYESDYPVEGTVT